MGVESVESGLQDFLLVLLIALAVAMLPQLFRPLRQVPYTLLLVIVGLVLALAEVRLVDLSPELILLVLLPPLLFQAGWDLEWLQLRRDLGTISLFAVAGVLITVAGTAWALMELVGLPLILAALVAASLAATDPVSIVSLFRELGVGKRLTTMLEGESLFNDGVAVVVFGVVLGLITGASELTVGSTVGRFVMVVGIGVGVGCAIGFGISLVIRRFNLPLVEQSLTLIAAYGSYLIAEALQGSGVMGVVSTSLVLGNFGSRTAMQPMTRRRVAEFWEFGAFVANSVVFLLIGNQVRFADIWQNVLPISVTVAALLVTRAISVYGLSILGNRLWDARIAPRQQTVLWWGGLRGSIAIALVLSVPAGVPNRGGLIAIVFATVLFTLLVQGLSTRPLLAASGLLNSEPGVEVYLEAVARKVALGRVLEEIENLSARHGAGTEFISAHAQPIRQQFAELEDSIDQLRSAHPHLQQLASARARQELLTIESDLYTDYLRSGLLSRKLSPLLPELLRGTDQERRS